jgi:ABC-type multidrug transport system ATPase subunit
MLPILSLKNISKSYNRIKALQDVSFDVPDGAVFGILGPNGSGKTTLLGIVMDVLKANAGTYTWFGNWRHLIFTIIYRHSTISRLQLLLNINRLMILKGY